MKRLHKLLILLSLFGILFYIDVVQVYAQNVTNFAPSGISSGISTYITINDKQVVDGDLISFAKNGYKRSNVAFDPSFVGVISDKPAIEMERVPPGQNQKAIISEGKVYARVSITEGGEIKAGDILTTSETPGIGQKANKEGYIIGEALESYNPSDKNRVGKILVNLHPGFNTEGTDLRSNLLDNLNLALTSPFLSPVNTLRYIFAIILGIISIAAGFLFFGRVTSRGIEALGRNPLASKMIIFSIIINLLLTFVIISAGIAIAYFILIL